MFNWIRKHKKEIGTRSRDDLSSQIEEIGQANGLNPDQIQKIIELNPNQWEINDLIVEEMGKPDKDYLLNLWMPDFTAKERKNIDSEKVLEGAVLGDIIGSTREFSTYAFDHAKTFPLFVERSRYTDDSILSVGTYLAIQKNKNNPDFYHSYLNQFTKHLGVGYGDAFQQWALIASTTKKNEVVEGYHSCANGSAMRVAPVGVLYEDVNQVASYAFNSAMVTHNHVEGVKGAVIDAICVWMALHGATKEEIYSYCKKQYDYSAEEKKSLIWEKTLFDYSIKLEEIPDTTSHKSLYANYAVPFAVSCFYSSDSFEACMREVLSHFCDSDTICSIAGALCAAYYGETLPDGEKIVDTYAADLFAKNKNITEAKL